MDSEFKIKRLETELRYEKELRELQGERLDTHDQHFAAIDTIMARTEKNIEDISASQLATEKNIEALSAAQLVTEQKLQDLIDLLTKSGTNGKH
jgi:hypothetical protein